MAASNLAVESPKEDEAAAFLAAQWLLLAKDFVQGKGDSQFDRLLG